MGRILKSKEGVNMKQPIIVLDPGHGGKDPGAVGNGLQEKNVVLDLALKIGKKLEARGAKVFYTRTTDVFIDLSQRAKMANDWKADFFMSLHINSAANVTASGYESFIYSGVNGGATAAYQNIIHRKITALYATAGVPDRGQKKANFAVLRETNMPAVLQEFGFISSSKDAGLLDSPVFVEKLAIATVDGIAEAFGLPALPVLKVVDDITGHWAEKEIRQVIAEGKMTGFPDGSFKPDQPVTRAQLAVLIAKGLI